MVEKVHALLQEFEEKQTEGTIESFVTKVTATGLLVEALPADTGISNAIDLSEGLRQTLQIFFSDIAGIAFNTYDYTTLKSLLNAHGTLERMAQKADDLKS
ncbi:hypothetical protein [Pontibacter fetidus]|uniref:Uncharacterized protein n=1 Tax=Pontibacter fetidus TaxID=2700082 RepID=A0A6B2H059_9BACT|nr:hypothetical protein [Pontibacter fetidus]NDK55711.1 hypothetical protein [Pontibacter fetidus]